MPKRAKVNKRKSFNKFRQETRKTPAINLRSAPMRGGIRL